MADKGFDIKVLIPTEDGFTLSENPFTNVPYYLMYNLSNRSYQLAGKIKTRELKESDIINQINQVLIKEKVDFVITNSMNPNINCKFIKAEFTEINQLLNSLIDKIDKKKEFI